MRIDDFAEAVGKVVIAVVVVSAGVAVAAIIICFPIKWLWNWLLPELFGFKEIDFWQAWGLSALCGLLFRSTSTKSKD